MTTAQHVALTLALILCALLATVHAQTPRMATVNITPDADKVHISAIGDVSEMRVDVADEAGEVVFQSGAITDGTLDWKMTDAQGERVPAGTYLVTVTFRTSAGKLRKRVEQVTVDEADKASASTPSAPATTLPVQTTGTVTVGRIPKFASIGASAAAITNSAITESAGKVGIGTLAPTTALTVFGTAGNSPAILAANNASGGIAIKGGSSNVAGIGVWGIHTTTTGVTPGVKGETNSTSANAVGVLGVVTSTNPGDFSAAVRGTNKSTGITGIGVLGEHAGEGTGVRGDSVSGDGVFGRSANGDGVFGISTNRVGVEGVGGGAGMAGRSDSGDGVQGNSTSGTGVRGTSTSGTGVRGTSSSGYAGFFNGKAKVTGNLEVGSCTGCTISSDQNLKANFSIINPRHILDRLSAIPIKSWNYKADDPSIRHLGAMAQDFRAAFNLGADDKHIDMIDANGVTMAAIQGLYQMMQEKDRQIEQQELRNKAQSRQIEQLQVQLNQVKRTIKRKRAARR